MTKCFPDLFFYNLHTYLLYQCWQPIATWHYPGQGCLDSSMVHCAASLPPLLPDGIQRKVEVIIWRETKSCYSSAWKKNALLSYIQWNLCRITARITDKTDKWQSFNVWGNSFSFSFIEAYFGGQSICCKFRISQHNSAQLGVDVKHFSSGCSLLVETRSSVVVVLITHADQY